MTTALFHINDNCLQIQQAGSIYQSQGYAWLNDDQVVFDLDSSRHAVSHCRLDPQEINSHYWQQCEQSAIPANSANMRHAADLIWQHLEQLRQSYALNDVVFVVPSHYQSSNLQLLLGIARASKISVKALVNKSVLALQYAGVDDGDYLHIDVQLHQTVCTRIIVADGLIKLGTIEVIQNVGIQAMQDALLKAIQSNFIRNDRFDPLHHAQTEQQMFDQLAQLAVEIDDTGKANVNVEHQQRLHTTSIDAKQWQACLAPFTKTLISAGATYATVFIDLNNAFNGSSLSECDAAGYIALTTPNVDVNSLINHTEEGESLVYKTELPILNQSADKAISSAVEPEQASTVADQPSSNTDPVSELGNTNVTHVLHAGRAINIQHAQIDLVNNQLSLSKNEVGNLQNLLSDGTLFVMNDNARKQLTDLQANDRLGSNLVDGVITMIQVG